MSRFYEPIVHVKLTTVQRNALTAELGMEIWNTDTNQQEYYDGSSWVAGGGGGGGTPADIKNGLMVFVPGAVPASTKITLTVAEVLLSFVANTPQSVAKAITAPTSAISFDIRTIVGGSNTSIGSVDFPANTDTGTFTVTATSVAVGDTIYIESPANVAGIADLYISLVGSSPYPAY
jgi:hypothetical protein